MFTVNIVSKEGLDFCRYLHLLNRSDPVKKENFLKNEEEIDEQELQIVLTVTDYIGTDYMCSNINRNVRYILPACVVSKIREKFPNLMGLPTLDTYL